MDESRARTLLGAERDRVRRLLGEVESQDHSAAVGTDEQGDVGDEGERLTSGATAYLVAESLRDRLEALDRAERRLAGGSYGRSIRSGRPIPDERLEADPAAELLVDEPPDAK
jgi:RNA polymerase-binding transcription factor